MLHAKKKIVIIAWKWWQTSELKKKAKNWERLVKLIILNYVEIKNYKPEVFHSVLIILLHVND